MELVSNHNAKESRNIEGDCDQSSEVQCDTSMDVTGPQFSVNSRDRIKRSLLWIKNKLPIESALLKDVSVTMSDLKQSLKRVQPSSKREGFATIPDVTWGDIGSLKDVREALQLTILVS